MAKETRIKTISYRVEGSEDDFSKFGKVLSEHYVPKDKNWAYDQYQVKDACVLFSREEGKIVISGKNDDQIEEARGYLEEISELELIDLTD